jgi:hypothetical protein
MDGPAIWQAVTRVNAGSRATGAERSKVERANPPKTRHPNRSIR